MSGNPNSAEGGSPAYTPENNEPLINEGLSDKGGKIWVNLNNSEDKGHSKMIETVRSLKAELQSVKTDNERILKAQEELNNVILKKLLSQEGDKKKEPVDSPDGTLSYKRKAKKLKFSDSDSSSAEEYRKVNGKNNSDYSSESCHSKKKNKKKRKYYEEITGEFRKIRPPTFNGEVETGEEAEAWLSGMKKYFQIYNYSGELKARMAIYNLTGKADIWWQDIKRMNQIREISLTWKNFVKHFKKQYLSEQYYEDKAKEFYELKLGNMTMKDMCSKFLYLLRYVPYITEEKPKVQRFLSCLPAVYKDRIEYDNPKTLEEAMRKAKFCYDQNKNRMDYNPNWKSKRPENSNPGRKTNRYNDNT